jgi:murein DD-endopeptidase MepM/ murein hydrolase activator NlpD
MSQRVRLSALILAIGLIAAIGVPSLVQMFLDSRVEEFEPPRLIVSNPVVHLLTDTIQIRRGDTIGGLLTRVGVDSETSTALVTAIRKSFDLRKFRAGSYLSIARSPFGIVESLEYVIDPDHKLALARSEGDFVANIIEIPGMIRPVRICGTLQSSLFESIEKAGERPELAFEMAEIFAWSLDFYTDPQPGDSFCVLVEKKEYEGGVRPATYQRILSATYNNAGTAHDAYLFADDEGVPRYYSSEGQSLQAAFLRSPLRFEARVSSHFSRRRFHPILKTYRAHLGSDYAAPAGTPVQAVANGRVVFSGFSGGAGNLLRIAHPGGYETQYMHLSRRLVRNGERVVQGQKIGLVGATGLATGPHLDFRIQKNGQFMDFERIKLPLGPKLTEDKKLEFAIMRDRFNSLMDANSPLATSVVAGSASRSTVSPAP